MLIKNVMQTEVVTIAPDATLAQAMHLTRERGIRHLPVVDGGRLVGIVSDRDFKRATMPETVDADVRVRGPGAEGVTVASIMTRDVLTIGPDFPVEDAARAMVRDRISALPVTEAGELLGIVTETDLLELIVRALGAAEPSSRLDVLLGWNATALPDVVETLERAGAPIVSLLTLRDRWNGREVIVRLATINPSHAVRALEARGYTVGGSWIRSRPATVEIGA